MWFSFLQFGRPDDQTNWLHKSPISYFLEVLYVILMRFIFLQALYLTYDTNVIGPYSIGFTVLNELDQLTIGRISVQTTNPTLHFHRPLTLPWDSLHLPLSFSLPTPFLTSLLHLHMFSRFHRTFLLNFYPLLIFSQQQFLYLFLPSVFNYSIHSVNIFFFISCYILQYVSFHLIFCFIRLFFCIFPLLDSIFQEGDSDKNLFLNSRIIFDLEVTKRIYTHDLVFYKWKIVTMKC